MWTRRPLIAHLSSLGKFFASLFEHLFRGQLSGVRDHHHRDGGQSEDSSRSRKRRQESDPYQKASKRFHVIHEGNEAKNCGRMHTQGIRGNQPNPRKTGNASQCSNSRFERTVIIIDTVKSLIEDTLQFNFRISDHAFLFKIFKNLYGTNSVKSLFCALVFKTRRASI